MMRFRFENAGTASEAAEPNCRKAAKARFAFVALLCAVGAVLAAACERRTATQTAPLLGRDAVVAERLEEGGALTPWARNGFRSMTVIHAGTRSGLDRIPDERIRMLAELARAEKWDAFAHASAGTIDGSNYLFAASRLGIVGKIYWIVPYPFFESAGGGDKARQFLGDSGLIGDRSEAGRFRMAGACLAGEVRGVEIALCGPDTMHQVREPALLDLDDRFFLVYARTREKSVLESIKLTLDALVFRGYTIASATVSASPPGPLYEPALAYVGAQVQEALQAPSILQQAEPPPLWKARDEGDVLLQERAFRRASKALKASLQTFGPDRGLRALLAAAALESGNSNEALAEADSLCRERREDCGLLIHLGGIAVAKGKADRADLFFRKAREALPGREPAGGGGNIP